MSIGTISILVNVPVISADVLVINAFVAAAADPVFGFPIIKPIVLLSSAIGPFGPHVFVVVIVVSSVLSLITQPS